MEDFLLNDDLDLTAAGGDLAVDESTYQHQKLLLFAEKGEYKLFPTTGVGSRRFLENEKPDEYAREIRQEFTADGMNVNKLEINKNLEIKIDANY